MTTLLLLFKSNKITHTFPFQILQAVIGARFLYSIYRVPEMPRLDLKRALKLGAYT